MVGEIRVFDNIELPTRGCGGALRGKLMELEIGQAMFIPTDNPKTVRYTIGNMRSTRRFVSRAKEVDGEKGVMVWRVEL